MMAESPRSGTKTAGMIMPRLDLEAGLGLGGGVLEVTGGVVVETESVQILYQWKVDAIGL